MAMRRGQEVIRECDIWSYLHTGLLQKAGQRDEDVSRFSLQQLEKYAIGQVLCLCGNNKSRASKILGISRESLYRKMDQYGIPLKVTLSTVTKYDRAQSPQTVRAVPRTP